MAKVLTADQAVASVEPGSIVVVVGSGGGVNEPSALLAALERRYLTSGAPSHLTVYHPNGLGDGRGGGTEHFAHPGFVDRVYGSHWSWAPRLAQMALAGEVEAVVWPQGVLSLLLRESAGGRPGLTTDIGIGTYVDPRVGTSRPDLGPCLVRRVPGEGGAPDRLFYPAPEPQVAFIRGTTADALGNVSMEHEGVVLEVLAAAAAVKRQGGQVVAQVKRLAQEGSLDPRLVRVPHYLVDAVVVVPEQTQSMTTRYNPAYAGALRVPVPPRSLERLERALIARRAALELRPGELVNVGFGISDGVATVLAEGKGHPEVTFTVEQGASGGIPAWDADFGLMWNPHVILDAPAQFDLYHGRGVDLAVVSFAEVDMQGNVNVSYFGGRLVGPGGFIDITQHARRVIFCGTFTARGLEVGLHDGRLEILREGSVPKFVPRVGEITFSGPEALRRGQEVLVVTERAVLRLTGEGFQLVEVAPGVDPDRQVRALLPFPVREAALSPFPTAVLSPWAG